MHSTLNPSKVNEGNHLGDNENCPHLDNNKRVAKAKNFSPNKTNLEIHEDGKTSYSKFEDQFYTKTHFLKLCYLFKW